MIFKHPNYGELRVEVNEEQELLFLMCDVADLFGLSPVHEMIVVCDSEGYMHWVKLPLQKDEYILAPCCDEQLFADLVESVDPKMQRMAEWVKNEVIPIAKDPKKRKKYLVKGASPVEEDKDREFCLRLTSDALFINNTVCLVRQDSTRP